MDCERIQRALWTEGPTPALASHLESCADCALEAQRSQHLRMALSGLQGRVVVPPESLEDALLRLVGPSWVHRVRGIVEAPRFRRGAAVGAAAAATAAVGVLVARRMGRPQAAA